MRDAGWSESILIPPLPLPLPLLRKKAKQGPLEDLGFFSVSLPVVVTPSFFESSLTSLHFIVVARNLALASQRHVKITLAPMSVTLFGYNDGDHGLQPASSQHLIYQQHHQNIEFQWARKKHHRNMVGFLFSASKMMNVKSAQCTTFGPPEFTFHNAIIFSDKFCLLCRPHVW